MVVVSVVLFGLIFFFSCTELLGYGEALSTLSWCLSQVDTSGASLHELYQNLLAKLLRNPKWNSNYFLLRGIAQFVETLKGY